MSNSLHNTLPVNSKVKLGCTVCTINGGTVRGANLFHSFSEFSVPTGGMAFFNNGLPIESIFSPVTTPTEMLSPDMVQDDFGTLADNNRPTSPSLKPSPTTVPKQLIEAQGWVVDDKGVVTLVASAPTVTPDSPALTPAPCQEIQN